MNGDLVDTLKSKVGVEFEAGIYAVERGMLQRFVRAIDDSNPRWQAEAPPTFLLTLGLESIQQTLEAISSGTLLHGSTELECYQPIRPGDKLAVTAKVANVRELSGKMGKTAFITFDLSYRNQQQDLVARCRQMIISY